MSSRYSRQDNSNSTNGASSEQCSHSQAYGSGGLGRPKNVSRPQAYGGWGRPNSDSRPQAYGSGGLGKPKDDSRPQAYSGC